MSADQPSRNADPSVPPHRYTAALADAIETRWQRRWEGEGAFRQPNPGEAGFDASRRKFYCLDMFPYPSGAGLHVGHPEGYTATDIVCRYRRMRGYNVLHPMGWDAFGLPAEQYAIQTGVHPAVTTRRAIDNFRRQLKRFGFCYDWSREFGTIDEDYYRWTQWVFLRIYESWYDTERGRARPIDELVREFESGERAPRLNPNAAEYAGAGDIGSDKPVMSWAEMHDDTRRMIVDSYRLAYVGVQTVNWCPRLGTALANEEVIDGRSERGGFPVFRKPLRQWMFRITAYAERLLRGLESVDWPESTRTQQAEWIGRSEGAEVEFPILGREGDRTGESLRVFTTRPDTIFGATYMVVAPEHPLVDAALDYPGAETDVDALRGYVLAARNRSDVERQESREKTGVFTGVYAINPATGGRIPVWTADYVLMGYGTGAIMAVPGQDQRDWDFARAFGLPIVRTVQPPPGFGDGPYLGDGPAINSGFLDGLCIAEAKQRIIAWLEERGVGRRRVNYRLRDWLFSRQRYWGEPFPIVWDERGRHHAVADDALPVRLPELADYQPIESDEPVPLLAKATAWLRTTAGEAGVRGLPPDAPVTRETNTMPGWAGSCWYYLRYCDPHNADRFVGEAAERYWMKGRTAEGRYRGGEDGAGGVDLYIGGAEHAVLHLLYARFWHKVLFDLGLVSTDEPFARLFHQGLILSHAYQREDKTLVPVDEVEERGEGVFVERASGRPVAQIVAKMSKSLRNVINPDDVIAEYGADTFRLYEMYMGPLEAAKPWNPRDITGLFRFLQRAWRLIIDEETGEPRLVGDADAGGTQDPAVEKLLHRTVAKVGADVERLAFNTAIAAMIEFVNSATTACGLTRSQADRFARVLAPFAPHLAEELWSRLGGRGFVSHASWPEYDESMLRDDEVEIAVQIAGKVRAKVIVPADADAARIESIALADAKVREAIAGRAVRKVIVVPGRLVNVVVG
ncbi:MAG: leucine--tRNA ligase [Leptolyngbya sp. PLA2]|nr:leucine--tRNA ligase [Leptolyngbya sp.]MCE7971729.1 leucine--tRNA ligase [Leptolyngbya sp. PL-A2]MCZ7634370.1 leucine--tRNA ligase [Phycisphaerales bacterium]MDL1904832.1 leucine--tRNA ligase [Synechococcales cyanobacterium CNB]GIK19685.1 MAG: leucine--tRNA ligase [Planctomycetota bacterium]